MPRPRPAATGYERLAQADRLSDDENNDGSTQPALAPNGPRYASVVTASAPRPAGAMTAGGGGGGGSGGHNRRASYSYTYASRPGIGGGGGGSSSNRRHRANSGVDLKAINARLERWADEIAAKFRRHGRRRGDDDDDEERLEIHYSVFQAPEGVRPVTAETLAAEAEEAEEAEERQGVAPLDETTTVISKRQFEAIVGSVRTAIGQGTHPLMISQGSSGSYFARNADGKVVGVFKPKDEEPYAAGNPKWNKWIHRNLFPCCFGRACLIPNLSYVSEAAAYVLDAQLRTHMVPYTDVVYLASKAFHYPFWDRYAHARSRKPLPPKPGSFQVFLKGFKDANIFLREHPWPDQYLSGFRTSGRRGAGGAHRNRRRRWADNCRPTPRSSTGGSRRRSSQNATGEGGYSDRDGDEDGDDDYEDDDDDDDATESGEYDDDDGAYGDEDGDPAANGGRGWRRQRRQHRRRQAPGPGNFVWTEPLKQSFREELEKLVILDYIMRNTDRGLDNWMIKVDWSSQAVSIASEPMHLRTEDGGADDEEGEGDSGSGSGSRRPPGPHDGPRPVDLSQRPAPASRARAPVPGGRSSPSQAPLTYRAPKPMDASSSALLDGSGSGRPQATITIGAIDNSLSWPWKHPDAWRSFPFGWLFLPVDLIGRPFSQKTREHFLPLLTSTAWWSQTQRALRRVFQMDPDFQERMFARQMAVMKGQAWNVVETLKTADHGPLELTRRAKVCVWDDLVEVPIAVPMRATSSEIRRRAELEIARAMQEEMDLGAFTTTTASSATTATAEQTSSDSNNNNNNNTNLLDQSEDLLLLGGASPLPHPGRFDLLSKDGDGGGGGDDDESLGLDGDIGGSRSSNTLAAKDRGAALSPNGQATAFPHSSSSSSKPRARQQHQQLSPPPQHQRRYSYTTAASRRHSNSLAQQLYGERMGGGGAAAAAAGPSASSLSAAAAASYNRHARAASFDHVAYGNVYGGSHGYGYGNSGGPGAIVLEDEDIGGDLGYAAAEGMENNRRRVIVERLEPVKSKNPVFTWC